MTIKPKLEKFVLASLRDACPTHVRYTMLRAIALVNPPCYTNDLWILFQKVCPRIEKKFVNFIVL